MSIITFYHDPTSEPSRAVHWLCLEANIEVEIEYIWLTRGDHISDEFLKVNPLHQVPALKHGEFCLSEATAIMNYLTDINDCSEKWFGDTAKAKAIVNKHLSWYHTNLRAKLTLDYFLPVLLMPAYLGLPKPPANEIEEKTKALKSMFETLNTMLSDKTFLCGDDFTVADLLFASDVFALDPDYEQIMSPYENITSWLMRLKKLPSYTESNKAWSHIVPQVLALNGGNKATPEWVASECESVI